MEKNCKLELCENLTQKDKEIKQVLFLCHYLVCCGSWRIYFILFIIFGVKTRHGQSVLQAKLSELHFYTLLQILSSYER